jgi:hypothetical protein
MATTDASLANGGCRVTTLLAAFACLVGPAGAPAGEIEFNRDIRPIFADHRFACHGPDAAKRKARLRLDTEAGAHADLGGRRAIVLGDPRKSELVRRITADDPAERMPPARTGRPLSPAQIERLRGWIAQGAAWQPHWSLIPPRRAAPPAVQRTRWPRSPIDRFILARLEQEGLAPSPEADRETLIRRVTLDLTGLPPTPDEVDAFLADESPGAYEKVVERLLASPRFGERMAVRWLDAARYADTNGYQSDGERSMWRWRDWVIDAYNRGLPFDRFTIEQLAGDLLPSPTLDQRIATGFNRNHRGNAEGGIIPEEYAVEYVADRVETTATVWLGLTVGCARCHAHKFDPITQQEFYRLFAYFNNVPENGRAVKYGNSPPLLKAPTPAQQAELAAVERRLAEAERRFQANARELADAQARWEDRLRTGGSYDWTITESLQAHISGAGRFDGKRFVDAGNVGAFGFDDKFSLAARVFPERGPGGTILSRMTDAAQADGYAVVLDGGHVQVNLVKRWLDDALRVQSEHVLDPERWYHIAVTYDGSRGAGSVKLYIDGRPEPLRILLDELNQSFRTAEPFRIGAGNGPEGRFHGRIDDVRTYTDVLTPERIAAVATPDTITAIAAIPRERRSAGQAAKIRACFLTEHAPKEQRRAWGEMVALRRRRDRLVESFPTVMVMQEMARARPAFVLLRGQYDRPGERVEPRVPACLPPLPQGAPATRLGLARWLVSPDNPLTARVAVNRFWQMLFGTGLVKTAEDFGVQGELPSHPELLDWLATEFVQSGWDTKAILRQIVTSATYRQSARATPALRQRDPDNRLLARGPRLRLSAEMVRDQALAASGLLVERLGGPSVKPYQPEGLWRDLAEIKDYPQDHGPDLYRRSLYTFWKRTVAPPSMLTFDAAGRETCTVREPRTNTPLQALTLLNDVTYVEAARVLAQRVVAEGPPTPEGRIALAFRRATGRRPTAAELRLLLDGYQAHLAHYRDRPEAARALARAGEARPATALDPVELAALTVVASTILNLDETITKE